MAALFIVLGRSSSDADTPPPASGAQSSCKRYSLATAHTALTSDYFAAASGRLGDALAGYLNHQPPAGLLR
jgi:hypothetical protein